VSVAAAGTGRRSAEGLPWPEGDAPGLQAAAGRLAAAGARVRSTGASLGTAVEGVGAWSGAASGAYRAAVEDTRAVLDQAGGALDRAAGLLRRLATTVDEAQDRVRELDREVRLAEEEAERAAARAAALSLAAGAADLALSLAGADPPAALQTAARDAADGARAASGAAADAQGRAAEVRRRAEREAEGLVEDVNAQDATTAAAVDEAADAAPRFGAAGAPASPALTFATRTFAHVPLEHWRAFAYHRAGIGDEWNPALGFEHNRPWIDASYAYYGELFRGDRDFQWAGMANLVAPTFYAGFQDMAAMRHGGEAADEFTEEALERAFGDLPGPADDAAREWLPTTGSVLASEAGYYETTFLDMQKQIFDDLVWQHEAYTIGGMALMTSLHRRGTLEDEPLEAWHAIDRGDVAGGNELLLYREQRQIIQDEYSAMRGHHGPVGEGVTRLMTWVGDSPIEGGTAYRDLYHRDVPLPTPYPHDPSIPFVGSLDVPLVPDPIELRIPEGNIASFDDRWRWIDDDMLPAYQDLLAQPGRVEAITTQPVAERAEDRRLLP
jgi:uncharacterized protein YukE